MRLCRCRALPAAGLAAVAPTGAGLAAVAPVATGLAGR
jgi:hypothetical protein